MTGVTVDMPIEARRCENCACYFEVRNPVNPLQSQGFCRREPPGAQQVRVTVPRLNGKGEPLFMRDGKTPQVEEKVQTAFVHELTARQMCCFDGWRPIGTPPGVDWRHDWLASLLERQLERIVLKQEIEGDKATTESLFLDGVREYRAGPPSGPPAANDSGDEPGSPPGTGEG
jgi:hypothetical protein